MGHHYFEIEISRAEEIDEPRRAPPTIGIGLCGEFCDLTNAFTGWHIWSTGYHGDDGLIVERKIVERKYDTSYDCKIQTDKKFKSGNTVGCGIDYSNGSYFFTLDGKEVGESANSRSLTTQYCCYSHLIKSTANRQKKKPVSEKSDLIYRKLYPVISHVEGPCRVTVNFNKKPFRWQKLVERERDDEPNWDHKLDEDDWGFRKRSKKDKKRAKRQQYW